MSDDKDAFGFGKYVPGFDFLQNLSRGDAQGLPRMPSLSSWVAPTINVEELDKRIEELKAVQFWLDQNSTALKATVQALEVQKMTLATLKGMNFSMADMAEAFKLRPEMFGAAPPQEEPAPPARPAGAYDDLLRPSSPPAAAAPAPAREPAPEPAAPKAKVKAKATSTAPGVVDPMQWWGALTEQFQQIAGNAIQEAAAKGAAAGAVAGMPAAAGVFGNVFKPAMAAAPRAPRKAASGKATAKKAAAKNPARKTAKRKPAR